MNITITSTPWNGNELTPTFLEMNSQGRLYLTYYNNDNLALMVKNPNSTAWFGSEIDIASEIALPMWSDDRRSFAPHSSVLGLNEQLHICHYDTETEALMYATNSSSLTQFALNEVPIQWSTTTISVNSSIQTGMLCSLEVDHNGDVHLFYAHHNDNHSSSVSCSSSRRFLVFERTLQRPRNANKMVSIAKPVPCQFILNP